MFMKITKLNGFKCRLRVFFLKLWSKRAIHREAGRSLEYFGIGPGALLNGKYKLLYLI